MANSSKPTGLDLKPKCQVWYLDEIRELLSEANMCVVLDSCFGHLFGISEIIFQGELVKLLCKRLHSSSLEMNSLTFNFGEHHIEFSAADFCLMSGLKFNGNACLPKFSKFHGLLFPSRNEIFIADIEREFREECSVSEGNSVRSLKLAYLIIIYGLLVNNNPEKGIVELGYIHLMEDVKNVNYFPWGLVAYEYLVKSTHRLKRELSTIVDGNHNNELVAYGFLYPLQCWAYEVLPALGTYCGSLNPQHLITFPRILKWCGSRNFTCKDENLRNFFVAEHGCNPMRISLSSNEIKKLGELGITSLTPFSPPPPMVDSNKHVGRKLDFGSAKRQDSHSKKRACKRKIETVATSSISIRSAKRKDNADCSIIGAKEFTNSDSRTTTKRKARNGIPNVTPGSGSYSNTYIVSPEVGTREGDTIQEDISSLLLNLKGQIKCLEEYIDMKFRVFECLLASKPKEGHQDDVKLDAKTNENAKNTCENELHKDVNLFGVYADEVRVYTPPNNNMFDAELNPWKFDPNNSSRENDVMLPTEIFKYPDLAWFNTLWTVDGWLDNTHIDALIHLLLIKYDKQCGLKNVRRWSCLEICCWQALTRPNMDEIKPVLMPFVRGDSPISGGLKWCEADRLFGVANIHNNHWVFYEVSLEKQCITVYNSLNQNWENILAHFAYVRRNLPILCSMDGLWESSTRPRSPLKDYWDVVNYSQAPKQVNQSDCGIMAIKFMECCAYNVPVVEINPRCCGKSRRRYCDKLFELSQDLKRNVVD